MTGPVLSNRHALAERLGTYHFPLRPLYPSSPVLELYQSESCPHSQKARAKLSELGVSDVVYNPRLPGHDGGDVTNERTHEELTAGGEDRIPSLVDTDREVTLHEAEAIVEYLREHYG